MVALRSATFSESVLWHADSDPPAVPPADLPTTADVVVVGGGYAGLSAARAFAEQGLDTVLLEATDLSIGASTRNGGMVIPELKAGPGALQRGYGDLGARLHAEVNEAFDHVETLIASGRIDCSYHRDGQLLLAHSERAAHELRRAVADHRAHGEDVTFLAPDGLEAEIGSPAFHGGALFARTGGLHPARFHAALLRQALEGGVSIHPHTRARTLDRDPSGCTLITTDRGVIRAPRVLLTTNASADALLPALQRRVLPIGSFIIATEVLEPSLAASISPHDRMMVDTKNLLLYWRLTPDGRLAFGGRRSLRSTTVTDAADFLYDELLRVHPQLSGTSIDFAWGGEVALTVDRLPHAGSFDGVWYSTGCNGSGVALMPWLGRRLALAMLDLEPKPALWQLPHKVIPLSRFRRQWTPIVGSWFRMQDRRV